MQFLGCEAGADVKENTKVIKAPKGPKTRPYSLPYVSTTEELMEMSTKRLTQLPTNVTNVCSQVNGGLEKTRRKNIASVSLIEGQMDEASRPKQLTEEGFAIPKTYHSMT